MTKLGYDVKAMDSFYNWEKKAIRSTKVRFFDNFTEEVRDGQVYLVAKVYIPMCLEKSKGQVH